MSGRERLQGWAFKAMSLNCILAKWDEWCFLIRLLTAFCAVKKIKREKENPTRPGRDGALELRW